MSINRYERYKKPLSRNLYNDIYIKHSNGLVAITGPVGSGKSWFGTGIGYDFDPNFNMENSLVYDVKRLVEFSFGSIRIGTRRIRMDYIKKHTVQELVDFLEERIDKIGIRPGRVCIFDEAEKGAYIREFFSQDNKTISKIVMMWRFLRMVVIFIVPEDLKYMENTITRFCDYKILMKGSPKEMGYAKAIVYKITGWNVKKNEPYIKRIEGCRGRRGFIEVPPLPQKVADEYEKLSRISKIKGMVEMYKEYDKPELKKVVDVNAIVDEVVKNPDGYIKEYRNREFINLHKIEVKFNVSNHAARKIKSMIEDKLGLSDR